jgi:hypothetical protein
MTQALTELVATVTRSRDVVKDLTTRLTEVGFVRLLESTDWDEIPTKFFVLREPDSFIAVRYSSLTHGVIISSPGPISPPADLIGKPLIIRTGTDLSLVAGANLGKLISAVLSITAIRTVIERPDPEPGFAAISVGATPAFLNSVLSRLHLPQAFYARSLIIDQCHKEAKLSDKGEFPLGRGVLLEANGIRTAKIQQMSVNCHLLKKPGEPHPIGEATGIPVIGAGLAVLNPGSGRETFLWSDLAACEHLLTVALSSRF